MVGGINSSARNIFWINNGTQSTANATIYEIWLRKQSPTSVIRISDPIRWKVSVYPNPGDSHINILLEAFNPQDWIKIEITDMQGRMILPVYGGKADVSELQVPTRKLSPGIYYLTVQSGQVWHVERIAIR